MCDEQIEGMDICLSDYGWVSCVHGHVICERCFTADVETNDDGELDEQYCPVCTFKEYDKREMAMYLLKRIACCTREEVFAEVKKLNKRRKKLYDEEYIAEVCKRTNKSDEDYLADIRSTFRNFKEFRSYINQR
jgi:hypothetical protein